MVRTARALLILAVGLVLVAGAYAQGGAGDLSGVVYDQTGAVVPKAKVTLTNDATGVVRTTETSDDGIYRFVALPIVGTYKLKVEAQGFKVFELAKIVISVARVTTEDIKLEVGAASAVVNVEAGAELVQTSESQLSELVDRRVWQSLPLNVRNQNTFINLLAGVVPDDFGGTTRGASVNGSRPGTGNFMVDGYDNNDQGQGGRGSGTAGAAGAITSISPEAIQEYRVVTSVFAAEYGKGGGFINDTVLKSGTNDWHGSAFWYNRVQALAANDFFSNSAGLKDRLVRNQFGGSLGGPVVKDKTFVYGTYEGHLARSSAPVQTTGTTQQFIDFVRTGAFRTFHETDLNGVCVVWTGATCPGQLVNSATLGPIVSSLLSTQPFPLSTDASTFTFVGGGPWTSAVTYPVPIFGSVTDLNRNIFNQHRITFKVDHRFGNSDTLNGSYLFDDNDTTSSNTGGPATLGPAFTNPARSQNLGLSWLHSFSSGVLNQARASYLRRVSNFPNAPGLDGVPAMFTFFDPLGTSFGNTAGLPQAFTDNQFQFQDHVSIVRGKHTFKTGAEYRRTRNGSSFEASVNGAFAFYGIEDLLTDGFFGENADQAIVGYPYYGGFFYATAAIDPTRGTAPEAYRGYRANEWAAYFQDDWKIHPRLTINVGLRYEYFGPPHNFRPGIDSNVYFGTNVTPIAPSTNATLTVGNLFFPTTSVIAARMRTATAQQRDNGLWNKDLNNFAPRLGFAWDVFGTSKVVIRGGGGIFYDRMFNNVFENIRFNPPFYAVANLGIAAGLAPVGGSSGLLTVPFTSHAAFAGFGAAPGPRHMDQDIVTAYTQQYNFGVQWQFAKDFVLETNYTTTIGNKLLGFIDINTFNGRTRGGNNLRINTTFAGDNFRTNAFRSNYHGFQAIVRKAFSNGLQFNANYTWGHAIDQLSDVFNNGRGAVARPTNNFNIANDRGNADFDIRHRFVTSYFYELPWMKDNRWVGGWNFSGVVTFQGGVPVQLFDSGFDPNADGYLTDRPLYLATGNINNLVRDNVSPADGYFDTTAFARMLGNGSDCAAGSGQFIAANRWWCDSPLGRNVLRGPGFANVDFSVAKRFKVTERIRAEFQANFFNLFNHPNFGNPVGNFNSGAVPPAVAGQRFTNPGNGTFGKSQFTINGPRVTQLALRFDF